MILLGASRLMNCRRLDIETRGERIATAMMESRVQRHWNYSSTESTDEQRQRLVHEYTQLDDIPEEWDPVEVGGAASRQPKRIPTAEEINVILRLWRSDYLRKRAWVLWSGGDRNPPVPRLFSAVESGRYKFTEFIEVSENLEEEASWAALNDADLFDFGADWRRVFDVLAELANCRADRRRGPVQPVIDRRLPEQDPNVLLEKGRSLLRSMLMAASISCLFIVDEEALRKSIEGRLKVDQGEIDALLWSWELGAPPGRVIEEGDVGEMYLLSNNSGREFFGLSNSNLEDKSFVGWPGS
ncbi:hypothetical protein BJX63DRAFT_422316 [Aspergillus granulosus]|uniref:Uncharacterized protein n=1 Tax=Aspergillus granulosus TaxID=176169 RepID=A0ABR4H862_9EURO